MTLPLRSSSAWTVERVEGFLHTSVIPARLACLGGDGFPLLCSLWYVYRDGVLWCATHESSALARRLAADGRCAFEVAPNEPPYRGVRGQARAQLDAALGAEILGELLDRYLGGRDSQLARWLLGRSAGELAIRIEPTWVSSWDYTVRMGAS